MYANVLNSGHSLADPCLEEPLAILVVGGGGRLHPPPVLEHRERAELGHGRTDVGPGTIRHRPAVHVHPHRAPGVLALPRRALTAAVWVHLLPGGLDDNLGDRGRLIQPTALA